TKTILNARRTIHLPYVQRLPEGLENRNPQVWRKSKLESRTNALRQGAGDIDRASQQKSRPAQSGLRARRTKVHGCSICVGRPGDTKKPGTVLDAETKTVLPGESRPVFHHHRRCAQAATGRYGRERVSRRRIAAAFRRRPR